MKPRYLILALVVLAGGLFATVQAQRNTTPPKAPAEHDDHGHGHEDEKAPSKKDEHGHDHGAEKATGKDEHGHDHGEEKHEEGGHEHGKAEGAADSHGHEGEHKDEHGHGAEEEHGEHGHGKEGGGEDEHGHEEGSASVGPGLAILEADEKRGIKLAEKAVKRLMLGFTAAQGASGGVSVPRDAVINQRGERIVYVQRAGWLTMERATSAGGSGANLVVRGNVKAGEPVVSKNAGLVRLAHLEAFGASGDGHGH